MTDLNVYQQPFLDAPGFDGPCPKKVHPDWNLKLAFSFFSRDGQLNDILVNRHIHTPAWLIGQLWACRDTMGDGTCEALGLPSGSSYAKGARQVRRQVRAAAEEWIAALTLRCL